MKYWLWFFLFSKQIVFVKLIRNELYHLENRAFNVSILSIQKSIVDPSCTAHLLWIVSFLVGSAQNEKNMVTFWHTCLKTCWHKKYTSLKILKSRQIITMLTSAHFTKLFFEKQFNRINKLISERFTSSRTIFLFEKDEKLFVRSSYFSIN